MTRNEIRAGVTNLLTTYQYLADTGKVERLAALFGADGVLEIGAESFTGPTEVLGLFTRTSGQFVDADFLPARHHLSSIYVEPLPDGSAKAYACFQFIGTRGLDHWGTYRDVVVPAIDDIADGDGWRFARRRVITEGFAPGSRLA
ncbi:nuclear transport factor 2 family protein [Mycolicibacterium pyrenivorans]|uniref:nuclear transport factor 2 family protein n=1 Tax=Mycolicibacterium pyrenivorans TaxID=187102 RepID=UPI0021F2BE8D|nr:nuclear transport factor 2 family protein [Mycolicibacterium pyrenivorans]MCV7153507.1 nuclear transport factor 2 family protein [Mycolicibacterium pyrenivorans]